MGFRIDGKNLLVREISGNNEIERIGKITFFLFPALGE
jgi:hypothetical protein